MALTPKPASQGGREKGRAGYRDLAIIVAVIAATYLNSLWGAYQFDDFNVIVTNPDVHSWQAWLDKSLRGGIRPLLNLSYMLNWVSGLGETGYHLANTLIHLATTLLVYALGARFVAECSRNGCTIRHRELVPLFTALLFAVHPIQTEAVAYISGRSAALTAVFYLAGILAYLQGARSVAGKWWLHLVSPALFIAAVATKEVAISLPVALLVWERVVSRAPWKLIARRQVVHWGLLFVLLGVILGNPRYARLLIYSFEIRSFHDTVLGQLNGMTYLLGQLFHIGSMNIDPDSSGFSRYLGGRTVASIAAFCLGVTVALWQSKRRPWLALGVFWVLVVLFPSNSIIPRSDIVNERHLYLANLGIFLMLVVTVLNLGTKYLGPVLLGFVVCLLAGFTVQRNSDYRSEIALWEQTASLSPRKSRVLNNLGCAYEVAGMHEKAAAAFATAIHLKKDNKVAVGNLDRLKARRGESAWHN